MKVRLPCSKISSVLSETILSWFGYVILDAGGRLKTPLEESGLVEDKIGLLYALKISSNQSWVWGDFPRCMVNFVFLHFGTKESACFCPNIFSLKLFGRFHPMSSSNDFPASFEFWNGNRQKEWYPKTPIISRYLQIKWQFDKLYTIGCLVNGFFVE